MLKRIVQIFGGDPIKRALEKFHPIIAQVGELESSFEQLSDEALRAKTDEFRRRFAQGESLDELLPEAFAAVREASKRTIGLRHYDVQIIGGGVLHQGKIAEMRTGEGKTLVATLPVYLNSLTGKGVHLITVNDYLARRDARWMAPIYNALGLSVGVLQMAARTENGKKAFLVDLERESPHEDQHQLRMVPRQQAYAADVTYGTNSEFGFDYLRDNMTMRMSERVQRGHHYAIVDEVDNVLIDEARTPLIISGPAQDEAEWYNRMAQIVRQLRPEHYEANEKNRSVSLTEIGEAYIEDLLGMALRDPDRPEDVTLEQARMMGYIEQAMRAQYLYRRNKDYLVQSGKVVIVDEFTGRLMPGRRWSDGLHQAVEAKEGVRVQPENVTYATITLQNYFRMYEKLAGMTGTALTEAEEFDKIYKLEVLPIPTNLEYQASQTDSGLVEAEAKDEFGYKYTYYTRRDDAEREPVYWRRKDYPDIVYRTQETKLRSVTREILQYHGLGRPMLVGTTSVELSENVSNRLRAEPLRRLAQVLLLRHNWFIRNNRDEDGRQVDELLYLNEPLETLDIAAMRKLARELDISFNPEEASNIQSLLSILSLSPADAERLVAALQGGIPHEVLNARKHTEESQIIAGAGAFGAVTIATNMAGRGVDIRLGGELAEEVLSAINRVLRRAGYEDPYDMSMQERWQALQSVPRDQYGIYESEVDYFFQYIADMERVRSLGGLHVIGSERHEARRIDNQLRGRAARQGDPGSSRFYLSMEDELMRLFGGQQADSLMQRMKIDDAMPLEVGLVSRLVEQSQSRVEGANFDVRKHLLEYDDVLNTQRAKIYTQRDRIFKKEDLTEDVQEMLRAEISRHIPQAMQSDEGPWKLIAWLDQIQPTLQLGSQLYPSFSFKLLGDHIIETVAKSGGDGAGGVDPQRALDALLNVAAESMDAEHQHLSAAVQELVDQSQDRLDELVRERNDALDTFFEGLELADETDTPRASRPPRELLDELQNSVRLPIRLSSEEQRLLRTEPGSLVEPIKQQLETYLSVQIITRLVGAIERRMEDSLGLSPANDLAALDWDEIADQVMTALNTTFDRRHERLLGESGSIRRDLAAVLNRAEGRLSSSDLYQLLIMMTQGAKTTFDRKTHRRVQERTTRLVYSYYAATFLEGKDSEAITQSVQEHLLGAQQRLQRSWGVIEFSRLASSTLGDVDIQLQSALQARLGNEQIAQMQSQALNTLDNQTVSTIVDVFGQRTITEVYRQLLLSVITELWVDYLTQMEALRVSIGLEAYAQRDPLVQYKNRASALFADLLANMRTGVVTRMFTYRPRDVSTAQMAARADDQQDEIVEDESAADEQPAETQSNLTPSQPENSDQAEKGKRRRRRRR